MKDVEGKLGLAHLDPLGVVSTISIVGLLLLLLVLSINFLLIHIIVGYCHGAIEAN